MTHSEPEHPIYFEIESKNSVRDEKDLPFDLIKRKLVGQPVCFLCYLVVIKHEPWFDTGVFVVELIGNEP